MLYTSNTPFTDSHFPAGYTHTHTLTHICCCCGRKCDLAIPDFQHILPSLF